MRRYPLQNPVFATPRPKKKFILLFPIFPPLTFYSVLVSTCTNSLNVKKFYILPTEYLRKTDGFL